MELETTGERVIEDSYRSSPERYLIYLFHRITYEFARDYIKGKTVLDYGCGSGYGSHFLAPDCAAITAVDISADAIAYAQSKYQAENLRYQSIAPAEQEPLPFTDASFDSVISFQVIEHIPDTTTYLSEIKRVLKPGGVFVCATPDRSTRLLPGQKPWNVWHVKEYSNAGFKQLLGSQFKSVEVLGMGGKPEVLDIELRRARRTMWLTLPFTLPIMPEAWRVKCLQFLKRLTNKTADNKGEVHNFDFSAADLFIAADAKPSTNLIAVAHKQ